MPSPSNCFLHKRHHNLAWKGKPHAILTHEWASTTPSLHKITQQLRCAIILHAYGASCNADSHPAFWGAGRQPGQFSTHSRYRLRLMHCAVLLGLGLAAAATQGPSARGLTVLSRSPRAPGPCPPQWLRLLRVGKRHSGSQRCATALYLITLHSSHDIRQHDTSLELMRTLKLMAVNKGACHILTFQYPAQRLFSVREVVVWFLTPANATVH